LPGRDELSWLAEQVDEMVQGLRQSKEELRSKNRSLEEVVQKLAATNHTLANTVEGIVEINGSEEVTAFNAAFAQMHGYGDHDMVGVHWNDLIAREDHDRVRETMAEGALRRKARCEVQGRRQDGSLFHEEIVMVRARTENGRPAESHWFTRDISERKELEAQIKYRAFHDTVTGLPNRAMFVEGLSAACVRAGRTGEGVAVLFLDLDDFKLINDSLGHEAGDHMLAGVAARIQSLVRKNDVVARLGGDEFTVMLQEMGGVDEAVEVAQRIAAAFRIPIELPNAQVFASASIGIAYSARGEQDAEALLHDADVAMYFAKDHSKLCYAVFSSEMNTESESRRELADALRLAIDADLLSLHYQPMIDLMTGRATSVEAFLRWSDPKRGEIRPELLVSVADEAGLMDQVWNWTLREACRQMKVWLDELPANRIVMNVNVSAKEIVHPDLSNTIAAALAESGLAPNRLRIEVSAKSLAAETERTVDRLRDLKSLGVALALDDFGTGSHLISKLGDYPFDMVKIDSSITWQIERQSEARAIAMAILIIAKSVDREVVAEGIETQTQLRQLQELGCTIGQGYIFGKPMTAEDLLPKLAGGIFMPIIAEDSVSDLAA